PDPVAGEGRVAGRAGVAGLRGRDEGAVPVQGGGAERGGAGRGGSVPVRGGGGADAGGDGEAAGGDRRAAAGGGEVNKGPVKSEKQPGAGAARRPLVASSPSAPRPPGRSASVGGRARAKRPSAVQVPDDDLALLAGGGGGEPVGGDGHG